MSIKKVDCPDSTLNFKFIVTITFLYFLVVFPGIQFFLRGHAWLPQYGHAIYFAGIFAYVRGIKKTTLSEMGFSRQHLGNHLLIGFILGGLMVSTLPFLDTLVSLSGLDQNELFSDNANQRNADDWKSLQPLGLAITVLIFPLLRQFFFTGLIYQSLSKKVDPMLALIGSALIFTLGHFKLSLGFLYWDHHKLFVSTNWNLVRFHPFPYGLRTCRNPSPVYLSPINNNTGVSFLTCANQKNFKPPPALRSPPKDASTISFRRERESISRDSSGFLRKSFDGSIPQSGTPGYREYGAGSAS